MCRVSVASAISKYSALPETAIGEWTPGVLADIDRSILFVLATWSGPSLEALRKLTTALAGEPNATAVLMVDIDKLPAELTQQLGPLRGAGETFWIRGGRVVAKLCDYERDGWSDSITRNNEQHSFTLGSQSDGCS